MFLLKIFVILQAVAFPLVTLFFKRKIDAVEYVSLCFSSVSTFFLFMIKNLNKLKVVFIVTVFLWNAIFCLVFFFIKRKERKNFFFDKEEIRSLIELAVFYCGCKERTRLIDFYLLTRFCLPYAAKEYVESERAFLNAVCEKYDVKKRLFNDFDFSDAVVF